jgi:aldehyde dehydrogenase (NAD+)
MGGQDVDAVPTLMARLRAAQARDRVPSQIQRRKWLRAIAVALHDRRDALYAAARADLNKPEIETLLSEVWLCREEAGLMHGELGRWMRGDRVLPTWLTFPSRNRIVPEPRGVVLVLGPWNYPIRLAVAPVLAAIAAGNRVILKPSERAPATAAALKSFLADTVGDDVVTVVEGGRDVGQALLREAFDLIFFTGSASGGRAVLRAAADRATPVVLELGGKSPAIVHQTANIATAARRIAWGKCLNAGQTCVAPDFVCVHDSVHDAFVAELSDVLRRSYPDQDALTRDYSRMIGADDFDRIERLVPPQGATRFGTPDRERLISPPTIITGHGWDQPAMQEEVFGPVLPILRYGDTAALLHELRTRPSPLAVYLFAEGRDTAEAFRQATSSGAFVVNDVIRHLSNLRLPFGGVGGSGFGRYHGRYGFETFSHMRTVVERSSRLRLFDLAPPYREMAARLLRWLG